MNAPAVSSVPSDTYLVVGGAGFIGSHFVDALLGSADVDRVGVYDNFSSGQAWHLAHHDDDERLVVIRGDVKELDDLTKAMADTRTVIHLASNPDIARAMTDPEIDFVEGTLLTQRVVEATRRAGVERLLYASGSGVYGDIGYLEAAEDHGPLVPTSTYGASKLAGEAMLSSYSAMFGLVARAFRFGNVVGRRQTHGVGYDFVRRLRADPTRLRILGDGQQSKSYVHVDDVVAAVLLADRAAPDPFAVFNVATGDYITVLEIAGLAMAAVNLDPAAVELEFTGGDRGWKGDVPIVRLDTSRIRALGWSNRLGAADAIRRSLDEMLGDLEDGRS
ncbi:MAG: NAD-dependent epimerase/dehydratase family protein [Acidimicrobiia bacterium]